MKLKKKQSIKNESKTKQIAIKIMRIEFDIKINQNKISRGWNWKKNQLKKW